MDDRELLAELKATLAARRREDPLVIAMSQDVKHIRTELHGVLKHMSYATGNASAAIEKADGHDGRITTLEAQLAKVQADLSAALESIEKMRQVWREQNSKGTK